MTSKIAKHDKSAPQHRTQNGQRVVILPETEYERLKQKADEWEPSLPEPDDQGNFPALDYARASLARKILRHRRRLGLTQMELARRAGVRAETLNRIEQGTHTPTVTTIAKIDRALSQAEPAGRKANSK